MAKSLINRRAAKAADSMWRRKGMFSGASTAARDREILQKLMAAGKPAAPGQADGECPQFIPEGNNPHPLCDNPACPHMRNCCISAHMPGPYDE